jgi:sugar (pentulose or hexulose) kinase
MRYIAGIDIGNSSTEVALATVDDAGVLNIATARWLKPPVLKAHYVMCSVFRRR